MPDVAELAERLDEIVEEQGRMRQSMAELKGERDEYHKLYLETLQRCRELERGLLGAKTERLPHEEQLSLAVLGTLLSDTQLLDEPTDGQDVKPHKRRKPTGRKALPEHLPRREHVLEDKASKDFREARANGRVLSSQVVKEFT